MLKGKLITINQAAELLSVSHYTIRRWIKSGYLPACKIGGSLRIDEADIEALLVANSYIKK